MSDTYSGGVYVSKRSRSDREWLVAGYRVLSHHYLLLPLGDDVRPAQVGGKMQGGVRAIWRSADEIDNNFERVR